jgi:dTDP-4-amino-4,6-dideoxygalactose transaminase
MELALVGGDPIRTDPFPSWPSFGEDEANSLLHVLRNGSWGGYNEKVAEFESAFAAMHGTRYAVSCANGTVALELALRAVGITCGDEVIVPPITFVATATSVLLCHGVPVFADIDPQTLNLSAATAERAITPRTRAIIVVHFGGQPADMDAFRSLVERYHLALIEDAAHAHGATWHGEPVGNFGVAATFSFQSFKLVTSGEGGIVLTNSSEIADKVWSYCNQGRRKGGGWFEHFTLGTNYRITGFQAAILSQQLRRLPEQTRRREENVEYLRQQLRSVVGFTIAKPDPRVERHPNYLVTLRYQASHFDGAKRETVIEALRAEGIPVQPTYPYPLYRNPLFSDDGLPPCHCGAWHPAQDYSSLFLPESERICREGLWLEHNLFLGTRGDVDDIVAACRKVHENRSSLIAFEHAKSASLVSH